MSITKQGKSYAVRAWWRDAAGQKHSKYKSGFKTIDSAREWENETVAQNQGGAYANAHKLSVSALLDEFLERCAKKGLSPKTLEGYGDHAVKIKSYLGEVLVQDLRTLQIQKMFDTLCKTPITVSPRKSKLPPEKRQKSQAKPADEKQVRYPRAATLHAVFRTLRAALNYARKLDVISANPCYGVELPARQKHVATIYTADHLVKLLDALREQNHVLYFPTVFSVQYALRRGEAIGIRWEDVDFENNCIHIQKNLTIAKGKIFLKKVKTDSSEDIIALSEWTVNELRELRRQRLASGLLTTGKTPDEEIVYYADLVPSDFVCLDENNKLFRPDGMITRLKSFQKAHSLPVSTWHDLRHTYGTLMAENGVSVAEISKAMRHSSIKITSDQYIASTLLIKKHATDAMHEILGFQTPKTDRKKTKQKKQS